MPFGGPSDPASTPINHFEDVAVICESQGIRESLERSKHLKINIGARRRNRTVTSC